MLDYARRTGIQPLHCRRLAQGIGGDGDPRHAGRLRAGQLKSGQTGQLKEAPGFSADAGRGCHCGAAMSRPSRTTRATRRRSTRAICWKKPTGAPSSVACALRGSCSPCRRRKARVLAAFGSTNRVFARVFRAGYALLRLVTVFTIGPKEAHAWTVEEGTKAPQAAGKIHSGLRTTR